MSLPLRHPLENLNSLDGVLEELLVRFIINVPPEDLSSVERELFHFEEASWFYTDFLKLMNPSLPNIKIKSFATNIIRICPIIWKWDIKADEALQKFSQYKKSIPVRGAAIFNEKLNKILLVQGTESDSWSFPRGKISKDEDDVQCCIREVKEEIGFDLTDYIDENQFIERNISGKNYKIFLVSNVSESIQFKPQVRNEIENIEWKDLKKIMKSVYKSTGSTKYYLINSMLRPLSIWCRRQKQNKGDDQMKKIAEDQLKLLLGIPISQEYNHASDQSRAIDSYANGNVTKTDSDYLSASPPSGPVIDLDPGRALLNSLQNSFQTIQQHGFALPPSLPQNNGMMLPIMSNGFQPFTPFPFANYNNLPFMNTPPHPTNPVPFSNNNKQVVMSDDSMILTPNVTSLSRPSLAQPQNSEDAKQLLSILNDKMLPESDIHGIKLLKRGDNFPNEQSENKFNNSEDFLNLLKKPSTIDKRSDVSSEMELVNKYEEFESSSDEEEQVKLEELDMDELPAVGTLDRDMLQNNLFTSVNKDIPHIDESAVSANCNIAFPQLNPVQYSDQFQPQQASRPKQKIKILKRGELLQTDITPNVSPQSLPYSIDFNQSDASTSKSLLNMLKKPLVPNELNLATSTPSNPILNISQNPTEQLHSQPILQNIQNISTQSSVGEHTGLIQSEQQKPQIAQSNAHELLNVLNSSPTHNISTPLSQNFDSIVQPQGKHRSPLSHMMNSPTNFSAIDSEQFHSQPLLPGMMPPVQVQSSSNELLNMLRGPQTSFTKNDLSFSAITNMNNPNNMNNMSNINNMNDINNFNNIYSMGQMQDIHQSSVQAPNQSASNQLLNILHRK